MEQIQLEQVVEDHIMDQLEVLVVVMVTAVVVVLMQPFLPVVEVAADFISKVVQVVPAS